MGCWVMMGCRRLWTKYGVLQQLLLQIETLKLDLKNRVSSRKWIEC